MFKGIADRMPGWPNERGWLTIALFIQTAGIIGLLVGFPDLRRDEFFKAIANAIVITGWIGFAVGQRQNAQDREQVGRLVETVNEQAKSIPNSAGPDVTLQPGETARAANAKEPNP